MPSRCNRYHLHVTISEMLQISWEGHKLVWSQCLCWMVEQDVAQGRALNQIHLLASFGGLDYLCWRCFWV